MPLYLYKYNLLSSVFLVIGIQFITSFSIRGLTKHATLNNFGLRNSVCMQTGETYDVDVAVLGGGIAGSSISYLLQAQQGCKVALIDPR